MNLKQRWISTLILMAVLILVLLIGMSLGRTGEEEKGFIQTKKETITLWYTDENLTDYLLSKAVAFNEANDVRVNVELVSGLEYLEAINQASIHDEFDTPDLFVITNDSLEKAYLAGLASEVIDSSLIDNDELFSKTARDAVSYKGKYVGYPFYFETAALVYNETYIKQIANEAELPGYQSLIPNSIVDILTFADEYSAPENVEYFFKWDVSDIFYNYFFIGNYISVGGPAGDSEDEIDIYNPDAIASLKVYQEMNQFFSIDTKGTNYASVLQEFMDGKTLYTIATSDCLSIFEKNEVPFEYGVATLPAINNELQTKGMSVTNALVVNGFSLHKETANAFISFLYEQDRESQLYSVAGKIPAWQQNDYLDDDIKNFYDNYLITTPIPKMVKTSNFWIELEACFAKVWEGADANQEIKSISENIKAQLTGIDYKEQSIPDPQVELLSSEEYIDEEIDDAEE